MPEVAGYPDDKIEIIAAVGLRAALGLADGDALALEVLS
jgi:CTP-dependent riboflavin kinase